MKNFRLSIAWLAMLTLIFTSCSKEETGGADVTETATLSFGAVVNDLVSTRAATKNHLGDIPECSDDTPSYVEIILMRGDTYMVGSSDEAYRVDLAPGQYFTKEDPALELPQGNYTLDHFAVYNEDGDLIWVAPRTGSALGEYVDHALPLAIDLRAGVKKYVDVSVLCFDNREVNEYGYQFFELDLNRAIEFCFFANYCPPTEGGRDYPANYSVTIWSGTDNTGRPLYSNVSNETGQYDNGDFYATPLCFALPDNDDLDEAYLYYEVTLRDWPANYGTVAAGTVISGTLTARQIRNNFDGPNNVNYEHLRFGCGGNNSGGDTGNGNNNGGDTGNGNNNGGDTGNGDNNGGDTGNGDNGNGDNNGGDTGNGDNNGGDTGNGDNNGGDTGNGDNNGGDTGNGNNNGGDTGNGNNGGNNGNGGDCETAIMYGDTELNDLPGVSSNRWGWVEHFNGSELEDGEYTFPYYAAAGQNDPSRGYLAGVVTIIVAGNDVHVRIDLEEGVSLNEGHIYFNNNSAPSTTAFGRWTTNLGNNPSTNGVIASYERSGDFWIGFHGVVCR